MAAELMAVSVIAELERANHKFEATGDDEIRCVCPAHEDKSPSASINTETKLWKCHACKAKGDIATFLAYIYKTDRKVVLLDLATRYDIDEVREISQETVEKFHAQIGKAGPHLKKLKERGITDEMIRVARLGYHEGRITIPIYDLAERVINVRRYMPGGPPAEKMKNTRGYGKVRLYRPKDVQTYDVVWVCGGEMKALVVGELLKSHKVGACAATGGEGSWVDTWSHLFKGKTVYVCMDVDDVGVAAAQKVADRLFSYATSVHIISLPLDKTKFPKGDVNDYVGAGAGANELLRLMAAAPKHEPRQVLKGEEEKGVKETTLDRAADSHNIGWRTRFEAIISAADTTPYLVPRDVDVACTRDQAGCSSCSVTPHTSTEGLTRVSVSTCGRGIADLVNVSRRTQKVVLQEALGIPNCSAAELSVVSHHSVHDVRLAPQLHSSSDGTGDVRQPALLVNADFNLNAPYAFEARVYPNSTTQQAILVIDTLEPTNDSLDTFAPSTDELKELDVFRQTGSVKDSLDRIYDDIEANVTRVYGRRDMHIVMDLAWHSVLKFRFDDRDVNGWVNALVIGDSAQGKSEASMRQMEHYRLGERVECKNATVPGLLGGLQQMGTRWFVTWGAIPMHDRRMVFLEELKGASVEVISKLTDMRSSGIAEIPKIERRKAHARTRICVITNARSDRALSSYAFGVDAIHELLGALEDVRRFDIAVAAAAGRVDVDAALRRRVRVEHRYTSELCRRLIMWAWTLKPEQVLFTDEAIAAVHDESRSLCEDFSEELPLIDRGTARLKLARLSAALAARLFAEKDGKLVVTADHVKEMAVILRELYEDSAMGYRDFSRAKGEMNRIVNPNGVTRYLSDSVKHPFDLVRGLLYRDDITQLDIQDWCEVDRDGGAAILSFLVRSHCLRRAGKQAYAKSPAFIGLLKSLETKLATKPQKPRVESEL